MVAFVHLHLHSCYSLRDSIIQPDDLIVRLHQIGQDTVAITDHGGSLGGVLLYKELKASGIKMVHGMEAYICDDAKVKDKDNRYYHLVLLCKNETGRINLNRLITISERKENKYYKPRIDFEILKEHKDGLIVLSACLAGEIPRLLQADDYEGAKAVVTKYKQVFGADYFLEVQAHNDPEQIDVNQQILRLAEDTETEAVVTCDAHYVYPSDKEFQNAYAFNGNFREQAEGAYVDCYVQSEEEVRQRLSYMNGAAVDRLIGNTDIVGMMCNVDMPLSAPIMPEISVPEGYSINKDYLVSLCNKGFKEILDIGSMPDELAAKYFERYRYELDSLERMGFADYILLVDSYANITNRRSPARGSGGGSLICYLTGITQIDPVKYGLLFERFIDVGQLQALETGEISRNELKVPDIDLDFATDTLGDILHFLYERYGEDKVASIGRFGTNKTKGTIRDMCKVLDINLKEADQISKAFDAYEIDEIDAMICGDIPTPPSANIAMGCVMRHTKLFQYVRKLNGLPKSFGLHPCGKIVAVKDLDNYLPSCYDENGVRYLQGDMHDTDSVGLVKVDVLGLRTLNQQFETNELSGVDDDFLSTRQTMDDDRVMQLFRNTDTVGIFQFASKGMQETLKKMQVANLDDLAIANALYRPGPMQYIDEYCRRRNGHVRVDYTHPDLEPILSITHGIMVYQEQLIEIGRMAGMHNPDLLRKATGKKDIKLMAKAKPELEAGLRLRGWNERQIDQLWRDMVEFSNYSFSKSHAYAYSMLAYLTAKQKAYYPVEFYVGLLNSYIGESSFVKDNADEIVSDIFKHNINIIPFDYRNDHRRCSVKDGAILYAIPLIKTCSQLVADQIYYSSGMQFSHFWKLLKYLYENGVNTAQMTILIRLGFFRVFGTEPALGRIDSLFCDFNGAKQVNASLADESPIWKIIIKHSTNIGKNGNILKRRTIIDGDAMMDDFEKECLANTDIEYTFKEKADYQKGVLGFVSLMTGESRDRPVLYVKGVFPAKRKADGVLFGHNIIAQSVGSGITTRYTIFNRVFDKEPLETGDVVHCLAYSRKGQYYNMDNYVRLV